MVIRVGIVDFDTSHVVQFTRRLNHEGIAEDQWVNGAKVGIGCPGTSAILEPERVQEYARTLREEHSIPLVERPEEMIGKIDAVLIESVDGSVHLERARPFLEAGIPTFVDKPFACSSTDAREMARLAKEHRVPLFSSSSLRYAEPVAQFPERREETGAILGCDIYCPASTHPRNPGLFHYGIHGVEPLYTLMGPGCESVWCVFDEKQEVVCGRWRDGRVGTVRGIRQGRSGYAFTAFCEKAIETVPISTGTIYRELLKRIVATFETGKPPLDIQETLEIVRFIEAALESKERDGAAVAL
jgi:predicted dehydrogenase